MFTNQGQQFYSILQCLLAKNKCFVVSGAPRFCTGFFRNMDHVFPHCAFLHPVFQYRTMQKVNPRHTLILILKKSSIPVLPQCEWNNTKTAWPHSIGAIEWRFNWPSPCVLRCPTRIGSGTDSVHALHGRFGGNNKIVSSAPSLPCRRHSGLWFLSIWRQTAAQNQTVRRHRSNSQMDGVESTEAEYR